jgi:hypothetical protein
MRPGTGPARAEGSRMFTDIASGTAAPLQTAQGIDVFAKPKVP